MDDGDCAERQKLQMPEKQRMPGQKLGQESVELRRAVVGINIPDVTGGLQGATGTYSVVILLLYGCASAGTSHAAVTCLSQPSSPTTL